MSRIAIPLAALLCAPLLCNCSTRSYAHYLVEPAPKKNPALIEEGTQLRPFAYGSTTVMKVRWNDGKMLTEVQIPMLATGQRVVIEHAGASEQVKTLPASKIVPPPPNIADKTLIEAYRGRGLKVNEDAPAVSIATSRTQMNDALKAGNYQLALEWAEMVLARYPSHPEFMRAKGSILLLLGEREKAIEIYESAEEIESDPRVRQVLEDLRKQEE